MKSSAAALLLPIGILLAVIGVIAALVVREAGELLFTLDDPYIHLSVAENLLRHGMYGINPGEAASPSSSILWPFALVPLEVLGIGPVGTFVLNVLLAVFALLLVARVVRQNSEGVPAVAMLAVAWFLGCNLVGLVFTGMEHTAQVAIVVAAALGALRTLEDDQPPRWLWAVLVIAPLVRYENMAVAVPLAVWLFSLGHRKPVILTLAGIGAGLGAFSAALWLNGMWLLPSSVVAKSTHIKDNGIWAPLANFLFNVMDWAGGVILIMGMVLVGLGLVRRNEADPAKFDARGKLALAAGATALLHLLFGRNGWFHRYEVYAVGYCTILILGLWPKRWTSRTAALASLVLLVVGWQYTLTLRSIPGAAADIRAQQYELHELALELDAPVGVNDLGWVSYRNDRYVYDFYGLGNYDATEHRLKKDGVEWMETAALEGHLELVMISTVWFGDEVPASWTPMGALCVDLPLVTLKGAEVRFFAPQPPTDELRAHIENWAKQLRPGSHYAPERCAD